MRGEVFPIQGPWTGQLAIIARTRGDDALSDEVRSWREAGVDVKAGRGASVPDTEEQRKWVYKLAKNTELKPANQ